MISRLSNLETKSAKELATLMDFEVLTPGGFE
jgi:hypothetical protein